MSKILHRTGASPFIAEFEELGEANKFTSEDIKREVANSSMVLLLLTPNVSLTPHTRSWVIYEASIAHALYKPVYVFEDEHTPVKDLPIPHVDCYWLYDSRLREDFARIEDKFKEMKKAETLPLGGAAFGFLVGALLGLPPIVGPLAGFFFGSSKAEELKYKPPQGLARVKISCNRCLSVYDVIGRAGKLAEGFHCPVCRETIRVQ
jgi:hypothetical protein